MAKFSIFVLSGSRDAARPATARPPQYLSRAVQTWRPKLGSGDCLALMRGLGHERFCVAGQDRGRYVAQRLTLDHPAVVRRAALLEGIPIGEALARCDARFAAR